jgi:hypothetical protein
MKKLLILAVSAFLLVSCGAEVIPTGDYEGGPTGNAHGRIANPIFNSEAEFMEFMQGDRGETASCPHSFLDLDELTHYYRLKNPPLGAIVDYIAVTSWVIVMYDTQEADGDERSRTIMIHYGAGGFYNIEEEGFWVRSARGESHIFEEDGLTYYIWKESAGEYFLWNAEWVNADGYNMYSQFPSRFTAEEVLGYISDLERVDIR